MSHPFQDKLFVFIGKPERCSTMEARDALYAVGGVTDDRISTFTEYVVEFKHNGKTEKYKKAVREDKGGYLILLNEEQFFDIIEGKAEPPVRQKPKSNIVYTPPVDAEAIAREHDKVWQEIINEKRLNNLAKYGVPAPDGSRIKADLRSLYTMRRIKEFMIEKIEEELDKASHPDRCDDCGAPARVHLSDDEGGTVAKLCLYCHNKLMAELTETDMPSFIPERLSFKSNSGEVREFVIEFYIFEDGKTLTAIEDGERRLKADVFGGLNDDFPEMLKTLTRRIEKALSTEYIRFDGNIIGDTAVGHIEYNSERDDFDIVIDGKPFTWEQLKKNIATFEGWGIKIEFGDIGDLLDADD